jgi:hypothetical protein
MAKYHQETGKNIPLSVAEDTPDVREYLNWRIHKVTSVVGSFADYARKLKPDVVIGANDFDMVMRNSPVVYGLNLEQQAQVQDITMIENFGIPKWKPEKDVLVNNAQTIRVARELVRNAAHLSVLSYDDGIGFDGMYHPGRFRQTIAEAAACGVTNTIKGTEYFHTGQHTMLTADGFEVQCGAIGHYQRWLDDHRALYIGDRKNLADVVLFYPEEEMVFNWHQISPIFFAAGQTLLKAGIPWRVARTVEDIGNAATVLIFSDKTTVHHVNTFLVQELPGWNALTEPGLLARHRILRKLVQGIIEPLWHSYFSSKLMRRFVDGLRLFRLFTGTTLFNLPGGTLQKTLLQRIQTNAPKISATEPVLCEVWSNDRETQIHLMNYADKPQTVTLYFDKLINGEVISPDFDTVQLIDGHDIQIQLNVYSILIVKEGA